MIIHGPKVGAAGSFSGGRSSRRLMGGSSGRRAAQSGAVAARADGRLPSGSSVWGERSTSSRPLGGAGRLFQGSAELRGSAAGGGPHVAGAQER